MDPAIEGGGVGLGGAESHRVMEMTHISSYDIFTFLKHIKYIQRVPKYIGILRRGGGQKPTSK